MADVPPMRGVEPDPEFDEDIIRQYCDVRENGSGEVTFVPFVPTDFNTTRWITAPEKWVVSLEGCR